MGDQRQPEWLEAGHRPRADSETRRRWLAGLAAASIAVVAIAGARSLAGSRDEGALDPSPSTFPSTSPTPSHSPAPGPPVVASGPTLSGVGNWEVYGRSEAEVVRLELRHGRMTRTPVPQLAAGERVGFLATRTGVLVRPVRELPGYQVPDSEWAAPLPRTLGQGGLILPGPEPDQVWITSTSRFSSQGEMLLASLSSGWVRVQAGLPVFTYGSVQSDGAGSFHIGSTGGTYLRVPGGYRRISTGTVLAATRASWLSAECDDRLRCRHILVDRRTGTRRLVRLLPNFNVGLEVVSLSPDSRYAAVAYRLGIQSPALHVIDLKTGADREVPTAFDSGLPNGSVVWSPRSDYLAAVGARGRLVIVASATAAIVPLGADLPPICQLAAKVA